MERIEYENQAKEKGESIQTVSVVAQEEKEAVLDDDEEEGSFDFDAMSQEEGGMEQKPIVVKEKPIQVEPVPAPIPEPTPAPVDDDDGDEGSDYVRFLRIDLADYEMPEIEEGELDKIVDPLANESSGRRKRAHAKVDYVALEAQLKKEEEEMRKKQQKMNE